MQISPEPASLAEMRARILAARRRLGFFGSPGSQVPKRAIVNRLRAPVPPVAPTTRMQFASISMSAVVGGKLCEPYIDPARVAIAVLFAPVLREPEWRTAQRIIRDVCVRHNLSEVELRSDRRLRRIVDAKHEAMYLMRRHLTWSLPRIGKAIGRDHSSVLKGIERHCRMHGLTPIAGAGEGGDYAVL